MPPTSFPYIASPIVKGIAFPMRFGPLGHLERSQGVRKLQDNMTAIVYTGKGERIMRENFGILGLQAVLRNPDEVMCTFVQGEAVEAFARDEPRVQVRQVDCNRIDTREGLHKLNVLVVFRVRGTQEFDEFSTEVV